MDADKPAQRKSYAGNTTLEILDVYKRQELMDAIRDRWGLKFPFES